MSTLGVYWRMGQPRQDDKANAMYAHYRDGHSLAQVAETFGVSRQSVYKMFALRGYELRSRPEPLPYVVWNGEKYTRRVVGYYGKTRGGRTYLHRGIWEHHHGPIPKGYDVHHQDGDRSNNRISNLRLLLKADHTRHHAQQAKSS